MTGRPELIDRPLCLDCFAFDTPDHDCQAVAPEYVVPVRVRPYVGKHERRRDGEDTK